MNELPLTSIAEYLDQHETKDLLRILTCGSVDDGKSTLIGRILYDTKLIYEDQLAAVNRDSKLYGTTGTDFDPALLTDGLKAEREQGITIDVAYRYFSTSRRKFIIADCPGHEQYTRNMATGASTCNLAIILIDARKGVLTQTRRHSFICSLLGIRHVVVAVNKMDLVDWDEAVYDKIRKDYMAFTTRLTFADIHFVPMSALQGDNVVDASAHMPWYHGPSLLEHLEQVNIASDRNFVDFRFPVQTVIRPHLDFRGFAGTVASGVIRPGDEVLALPSRRTSRVKSIVTWGGDLDEAFPPMAVTLTLEDEIDLSRGDMLVHPNNVPRFADACEAMVVWMHPDAGRAGGNYWIKHTTNLIPGTLETIRYKVDVNTMRKQTEGEADLQLNEIGRIHLSLHRPLAFDPYDKNHATGCFILIDRVSNVTVGAGMILDRLTLDRYGMPSDHGSKSTNIRYEDSFVTRADRERLLGQRACTVWLTGLSGSGKSTLAKALERTLHEQGRLCYILDGDNVRHGLNRDLGFSAEDRSENIRRIAEVARLLNDAGIVVITAFISPYRKDRALARGIVEEGGEADPGGAGSPRFVEVHVDAPLDVCEARDPKGLYKKARSGEIAQFTGISAPYEAPDKAELVLDTANQALDDSVEQVLAFLRGQTIVP